MIFAVNPRNGGRPPRDRILIEIKNFIFRVRGLVLRPVILFFLMLKKAQTVKIIVSV